VVLEVLTVVTVEIFVLFRRLMHLFTQVYRGQTVYKVMFMSLYKGSQKTVLFSLFGLWFVTLRSVVILIFLGVCVVSV
jgi:hypothetical protein